MSETREALEQIEAQALAVPLARDELFELIDMLQNIYGIAIRALSALDERAEERERAALIVERWSLPTIQTPSMWLIDKAGIAAAIRAGGTDGH